MTNIRDGTIIQGLPSIVGNQAYTQALSYAIQNMFRMILDYADKARTYSGVDIIDSHALMDALAYELRASPYSDDYDINIKRSLVTFALQYWSNAGTKTVTEEVVRRVFGDANITEWFEYNGNPGCFSIGITDLSITDSAVLSFKEAAENVKRLSAWLDKVQLIIKLDKWKQFSGYAVHDATIHALRMRRTGTVFTGHAVQDGTTHVLKMTKTKGRNI